VPAAKKATRMGEKAARYHTGFALHLRQPPNNLRIPPSSLRTSLTTTKAAMFGVHDA
jgi:hypothetical protein